MTSDFHERELAELQQRWRLGDLTAIGEAFQLCVWRSRPVPDWLEKPIVDALLFSFNCGDAKGSRSQGRGSHRARSGMSRLHRVRWSAFKLCEQIGEKFPARAASEMLVGNDAWGQPRQIRDSYNIVENALKAGD